MVKKCLIHAKLTVYENIHQICKQLVQIDLDDLDAAKKYQAYLWHKTKQNLTGTDTCENIRLIQAYIYHGYYKMFSKGLKIMAIHHQLS